MKKLRIVRTNFIPATNTKGARISVFSGCGKHSKKTYGYPYEKNNAHEFCVKDYLGDGFEFEEVEDETIKRGKTFVFWSK